MDIRFPCICGYQFQIDRSLAGKQIVCPECGKRQSAPALGRLIEAKSPLSESPYPEPESPPLSTAKTGIIVMGVMGMLLVGLLSVMLLGGEKSKEPQSAPSAPQQIVAVTPKKETTPPVEKPKKETQSESPKPTQPSTKRIVEKPTLPAGNKVIEAPTLPAIKVTPTTPEKPMDKPKVVFKPKIRPKLENNQLPEKKVGQSLYQLITVQQQPTYSVQGIQIPAVFSYRILSKFTVKSIDKDGARLLDQKIIAAKLLQADQLSSAVLGQAVQQMNGKSFQMTLDARGKITKFTGEVKPIAVMSNPLLGGKGFQVGSVLDQDGWIELNEKTFLVPKEKLTPGVKWPDSIHHSWGPLGYWAGMVHYQVGQKKGNIHPIGYQLLMKYTPPNGGRSSLPFDLLNSRFQVKQAGGIIYYDESVKQVAHFKEQFHVQGVMSIRFLGQQLPVTIDEKQLFEVNVYGDNPMQRQLRAK